MASVVLERDPAVPQMSLEVYRHLLRQCRDSHDPQSYMWILGVTPDIEETERRDSLMEVIRRELADHIEGDRLHSGVAVIGGRVFDGSSVEEILQCPRADARRADRV